MCFKWWTNAWIGKLNISIAFIKTFLFKCLTMNISTLCLRCEFLRLCKLFPLYEILEISLINQDKQLELHFGMECIPKLRTKYSNVISHIECTYFVVHTYSTYIPFAYRWRSLHSKYTLWYQIIDCSVFQVLENCYSF